MVNNGLGTRALRDLSMAELQRKTKKKGQSQTATTIGEHQSQSQQLQQPQYANQEMIHAQMAEIKMAAAQSQQPAPPAAVPQQQKSILKDPLCAKLRSAIRKGKFAMTDPAKFESEIDSLLHNKNPANNNIDLEKLNQGGVLDRTGSPGCDMLGELDTVDLLGDLTQFDLAAPYKTAGLTTSDRSQGPNLSNSPNSKHSLSSSIIANQPCNSYIQMIEEKYRHKESNSSSVNSTTTEPNNSTRQSRATKGKSSGNKGN